MAVENLLERSIVPSSSLRPVYTHCASGLSKALRAAAAETRSGRASHQPVSTANANPEPAPIAAWERDIAPNAQPPITNANAGTAIMAMYFA
ncbi:MAG TPA: hypothetical protein VFV18_07120, partial [Porticoccaceae bacterium]|nr:hypothetical protein [Porticoccaceae bacterium]